jgi:hypothetical protein
MNDNNYDPEDVQRGNGRLILVTSIVGAVLFVAAMAFLFVFGVPIGPMNAAQPTQQQQAATHR